MTDRTGDSRRPLETWFEKGPYLTKVQHSAEDIKREDVLGQYCRIESGTGATTNCGEMTTRENFLNKMWPHAHLNFNCRIADTRDDESGYSRIIENVAANFCDGSSI